MRRLLVWILLLAVTLTVAMWRAPASMIALFLTPESARIAQLHSLTGTLWSGAATLSITGVPPTLSVAWRCRPSLSPLGLYCQLNDSIAGSVSVDALASALRAETLTATLPIQVAAAGITLGGSPQVMADFASVVATKNALAIKGTVRAFDAVYRVGNGTVAIGELTVDCAPAADAISSTCAVSNRGGSARLDGKLTLTPSKASGELTLTPTGGATQRVVF